VCIEGRASRPKPGGGACIPRPTALYIVSMTKITPYLTLALLAGLTLGCGGAPAPEMEETETSSGPRYLAYFGTYTRGDDAGKGIYAYRFDAGTGEMTDLGLAAEVANPSFVAIHPNNQYLYAVTEDFEGEGAVSAFSIDHETGKLTLLNQVSSGGSGPCHLNVDASGKMLAVANYGAGSTSSFQINADGTLSEAVSVIQHEGSSVNERRQKGPHAHSVNFSPDNRFVITADLGTDELYIYKADPATGNIEPNVPPSGKVAPGGGPRHFTFHPSGKFCYAINEMGNTVTAFKWDAETGAMEEIQMISTLPEGYSETSHTAEVRAHPSGKFLYGSNRGHDSIAVFSIDQATGKLTAVEYASTQGETPRNFNLDPTGQYLFAENQNTNNVVTFSIDQETGKLTPTGQVLNVPKPVCLRWVPLN